MLTMFTRTARSSVLRTIASLAVLWGGAFAAADDPPPMIARFADLNADGVVSAEEVVAQIGADVRGILAAGSPADPQPTRFELIRYAGALFGDLNSDGQVDAGDVAVLLQGLRMAAARCPRATWTTTGRSTRRTCSSCSTVRAARSPSRTTRRSSP